MVDTRYLARHAEQAPAHIKVIAKGDVTAFKVEILETVARWIEGMELEEGITAEVLQRRIVGAIRVGLKEQPVNKKVGIS